MDPATIVGLIAVALTCLGLTVGAAWSLAGSQRRDGERIAKLEQRVTTLEALRKEMLAALQSISRNL